MEKNTTLLFKLLSGTLMFLIFSIPAFRANAQCSASFIDSISGNTVYLANTSTGPYSIVQWSLGDGNLSYSDNFAHSYSKPGYYRILLEIMDSARGCYDSASKLIKISGNTSCNSNFAYSQNGNQITFINNSSGTEFNWSFGDGNSSKLKNPTHTYKSPGNYNVCLLAADSSHNCLDTSCQQISIQSFGTMSISGFVWVGRNQLDQGKAYLVYYDSSTQVLSVIDSTSVDSLGFYSFSPTDTGSYMVLAFATSGSSYYSNHLPTYFGNTVFWDSSTQIQLPTSTTVSYDISLVSGYNPGGPAFIGGKITQGKLKKGEGDPMGGILVLLLDDSGKPVTNTYSASDGTYKFDGIPYGTYKIYPEIPGKTTYPVTVTVSESNPTVNNVDVKVNKNDIITGLGKESPGLNNSALFSIYPNPVQETLKVDLKTEGVLGVTVLNLLGEEITSLPISPNSGNMEISIPVGSLEDGIYFLRVRTASKDSIVKFIKAR